MIQAVLWDFGGVFTPSPFSAPRAYAESLGLSLDDLLEVVFGPYHLDNDHPWHKLERGEGTLADAMAAATVEAERRGFSLDARAFFATMASDGVDRSIVVEKVRQLRASGVRNAIITNNAKEFSGGWRGLLPVDELFDLIVDSCEVGMRKPNPAIYELALDQLGGVAPEASVFLDDFAPNVEAARRVGCHGVVVTDPVQAMTDLDRIVSSAGRS